MNYEQPYRSIAQSHVRLNRGFFNERKHDVVSLSYFRTARF